MSVDYFGMCMGQSLNRIGHAADIIWIIIGDVAIHLSSNAIILMDGKVVAQTQDLYFDVDGNSTQHIGRYTLFDKIVGTVLDTAIAYQVEKISITQAANLHIIFSNGLQIKTLENENYEDEKWRILIKGSSQPHMVAYASGIEWH